LDKLVLPKIFIGIGESDYNLDVDRSLLILEEDKVYIKKPFKQLYLSSKSIGNVYVEEIYDDAYKYFLDIEQSAICRNVCTVIGVKALFLNAGDPVVLREFIGKNIVPMVSVGEKVEKSTRLVAIFTGKREVRYGLSQTDGVVFYFTQIEYKPQKYLFVISQNVVVREVVGCE